MQKELIRPSIGEEDPTLDPDLHARGIADVHVPNAVEVSAVEAHIAPVFALVAEAIYELKRLPPNQKHESKAKEAEANQKLLVKLEAERTTLENYMHTERPFGEVSPALLADIVELDEKIRKLCTRP